MKRTLILTLAIVALAIVPAMATAQTMAAENASGTVVSVNGTTLVLKTATGDQTYILAAPQQLAVGAPVSVTFTRSGNNLMVSKLVPTAAPAPAAPAAGAINNNRNNVLVGDKEDDNVTGYDKDAARDGTDPGQSAAPVGALNNNRNDRVVLDGEDDNVTGLDTDASRDGTDPGQSATGTSLPATASPLGLLALLGGAALVGATALRSRS